MQYMPLHSGFCICRKGCGTKNLSVCVQPCTRVSEIIDASGFYLTDLNTFVAAVEANTAHCSSVPVLMKSPFSG